MKEVSQSLAGVSGKDIAEMEKSGQMVLLVQNQEITLIPEDVEIFTEDIPGWLVSSDGNITIALDVNITPELRMEGIAREFINKIQNIRKESGFEVTDRIGVSIAKHDKLDEAVRIHREYISAQTLATSLELVSGINSPDAKLIEIDPGVETWILVEKR